jgi:hypothetical protein
MRRCGGAEVFIVRARGYTSPVNCVDGRTLPGKTSSGRSAGSRLARVPVFPLAAAAAAAAVLGHRIAYFLAIPSLGAREALLARTGHAYLPGTTEIVVLAALAGLGGLFLAAVSRGDVGIAGRGSVFLRLAAVQVSIFASTEVIERLASGAPVSGIFEHGLFAIGIGVQLVLALAGAVVFALTYRAAEVTRTFAASAVAALRRMVAIPAPVTRLATTPDRGPVTSRGPPSR